MESPATGAHLRGPEEGFPRQDDSAVSGQAEGGFVETLGNGLERLNPVFSPANRFPPEDFGKPFSAQPA